METRKKQNELKKIIDWQAISKIFMMTESNHQRVDTAIDELKESKFEERGKIGDCINLQNSDTFFNPPVRSLNTSKVFMMENLEQEVKRLKHMNLIKEKEIEILKQ